MGAAVVLKYRYFTVWLKDCLGRAFASADLAIGFSSKQSGDHGLVEVGTNTYVGRGRSPGRVTRLNSTSSSIRERLRSWLLLRCELCARARASRGWSAARVPACRAVGW